MLSLLVSLSLLAASVGICLALHWYVGYGIAVGLVLFFTTNYLLARTIGRKVEARMREAGDAVAKGHPERAVEILEGCYPLARWQFLLRGQIDGQIGVILYAQRKFDEALPYLERSSNRHWIARAMLGVLYMKRKRIEDMKRVFDKAVAANRKEGMLASLYAYCLAKVGEREAAMAVLTRALEKLEGDGRLEANLKALQNRRPMKMKNYGDLWYQFHLERPAGAVLGQRPRGPQPRIRRKALRR